MIDFLKRWILNIVTLVMFIVLLEIIIPSGKIKKFISLISGFILIIAIITPFLNLFVKGIDVKEFEISTRNFIDKKEIEKKSKVLQERELKQVAEIYRKKVIAQLEAGAKQVEGVIDAEGDVIINEDYSSNSFGKIKRAYLKLKLDKKGQDMEAVTKVEKVEIDLEEGEEEELKEEELVQEDKNERGDDEIRSKVEEKISRMLNIQKENVVVSVQ